MEGGVPLALGQRVVYLPYRWGVLSAMFKKLHVHSVSVTGFVALFNKFGTPGPYNHSAKVQECGWG